jgi:hypothetical protein
MSSTLGAAAAMMDSWNGLYEITDLAIVGYYIANKFINADSQY